MKLPRVQYRGVESVGRHDLGAVSEAASVAAQRGRAIQQVSNQLAGVVDAYRERKENAEYNEVLATMKAKVMEWESEFDVKQTYTADELGHISEDIVPRIETGTDPVTGDTFSSIRGNIPAHEVYPHLKKGFLTGLVEEQANKISNPHLRKQFMTTAKPFVADKMMRAVIAAEQAQQAYVQSQYEEGAAKAAQLQDMDTAQFFIDQMEGLSDVEKRTLTKKLELVSENAFYDEVAQSPDPETVMLARQALMEPTYDGPFNQDQRQSAIKDMNERLKYLDRERVADEKRDREEYYSNLNIGVNRGTTTYRGIDEAHKRGLDNEKDPTSITSPQRTALYTKLDNLHKSNQDEILDLALFDEIMSGRTLANPENNDHRKAIETAIEVREIADPAELFEIVGVTSYIPQKVQDRIEGGALNGDAEQFNDALVIYGSLEESAPHTLKTLGANPEAVLAMASQMVRTGSSEQSAMEISREAVKEAPERREARQAQYKVSLADDSNTNSQALGTFMDKDEDLFDKSAWYTSDVDINPEIVAEFGTATERYFLVTPGGNLDLARTLAYRDIRKTWGIGGVGGRINGDEMDHGERAQKYAPERLLNITTPQANTLLKAYTDAKGIKFEQAMIFEDEITARTGASWRVVIFDEETGEIKPHPDRWIPYEWITPEDRTVWDEAAELAEVKADRERAHTATVDSP